MPEAGKSGDGGPVRGALGGDLQGQITELNVQVLEAVRRSATSLPSPLPLRELVPQWRALGERQLLALARCPCLLLDAGFAQPDCWDGGVHEAALGTHWLATALAPELFRRAVMLGWHLARANPFAARITLGMTPRCAELIASTRLRELEMLVERRAQACRLRWEERPPVWRQLLQAALTGTDGTLEVLQLRGVQLLAADDAPVMARVRST